MTRKLPSRALTCPNTALCNTPYELVHGKR
jgi:hypothetical protein